ncbi:restriction endonuclease subunit S [Dinoroseobacter sp. S124A]|uniref:restriction endonuclease subunit S n=1 Tax=Dinoroseobacter sp. S124A TaxID=3415128 RepID=UPI003C7A874B
MTIPKRKLGELGEFRNGLNYSKENFGTGLKVISVKDFGDRWRPDLTILDEISPAGMRIANSNLQRGDIVFVRSNGNKELIGRSMLIEDDLEDVSFSGFCIRFRPSDPNTNSRFLSLFFRTSLFRRVLSQQGKGTNINNLNQSILERMEVPFPQPIVQGRITEVASAYDDLIENNRRRIALWEEAARLLYREWFVHFRFPGHEHVKITDGVPEGWERRTLGDVVDVIKDTVKPADFAEDDIHVGLEHIPRRSFTLANWEPAEDLASGKNRFSEGDILFCKIRPYFHKVGFTLRSGLASSDAIVWRVKESEDWPLVVCATSSDHFVAVASKTVREGSKMPRADVKVLQGYSIPKPPEGLLSVFNDTVLPITQQCKTLALQNRALSQARDLLLPRLMNGEIAV